MGVSIKFPIFSLVFNLTVFVHWRQVYFEMAFESANSQLTISFVDWSLVKVDGFGVYSRLRPFQISYAVREKSESLEENSSGSVSNLIRLEKPQPPRSPETVD
jgi:hypothetical protein